MKFNKLLAGLCAGLLFCVQSIGESAVPNDVPKDVKYLLGFYYGNGENILLRENNGEVELLYRTLAADNVLPKLIFSLYRKIILILILCMKPVLSPALKLM